MAWGYEQNFNSLTDGDLNGQDSWTGSTNYDVQTSVKYEGAKAVVNSTNANADIQRDITATSSGIVYVAMRKGVNNAGTWGFKLRNAAGSARTGIVMNASGNIVLEGGSPQTLLTGYSAATWYIIRITYNATTGAVVAAYSTGGAYTADSSDAVMANTGDIGRILIVKDAATGSDYIDTITATDPLAVADTFIPQIIIS